MKSCELCTNSVEGNGNLYCIPLQAYIIHPIRKAQRCKKYESETTFEDIDFFLESLA